MSLNNLREMVQTGILCLLRGQAKGLVPQAWENQDPERAFMGRWMVEGARSSGGDLETPWTSMC